MHVHAHRTADCSDRVTRFTYTQHTHTTHDTRIYRCHTHSHTHALAHTHWHWMCVFTYPRVDRFGSGHCAHSNVLSLTSRRVAATSSAHRNGRSLGARVRAHQTRSTISFPLPPRERTREQARARAGRSAFTRV